MVQIDEQSIHAQWIWQLPAAEKVLVFAPHPDDEVFGCAGILLELKAQGADIHLCIVTDGSCGGNENADDVARIRESESRQAAELLGFDEPRFLGFVDRQLSTNDKLADVCLDLVQDVAPDLVFVTAPSEPHPDHCALAHAVGTAAERYDQPCKLAFYEVGYPLVRPNLLVDISAHDELKCRAMKCFPSQLKQRPYHTLIGGLNHYRSYLAPAPVTSVEAFFLTDNRSLQDGLPAVFDWSRLCRQLTAEKKAVTDKYIHLSEEWKRQVAEWEQLVAERERWIAERDQQIHERDQQIHERDQQIHERDQQIHERDQQIHERDQQIHERDQQIAEREQWLQQLQQTLAEVHASSSWRLTAPLRSLSARVSRVLGVARRTREQLAYRGGVIGTARNILWVLRREGAAGIKVRLKRIYAPDPSVANPPQRTVLGQEDQKSRLRVVPWYPEPQADPSLLEIAEGRSTAIHLHLYYQEMLTDFEARLASMPCCFDLYVSVCEGADCQAIAARLRKNVPALGEVFVEVVPNRGRDLAPLIIQFGERLLDYRFIAHFHTKKSPHNPDLTAWRDDILDLLLGPMNGNGSRPRQIIRQLADNAKLIFPEGQLNIIKDPSGWGANYAPAAQLLSAHSSLRIEDFPQVEFPEGSMFWARAECLQDLLRMPLRWQDFPAEPVSADGTFAHALERLLLVFANDAAGDFYRIHHGDSIHDYRYYEEQQDFSADIFSDVRVLSYYLPQFHPIPENDEWHGEGFTEWTKVKAANPLFAGHYQQHIPHKDIGYYLLDDPSVLKKQTEQMRQAGVYGQVFYHYWFTGKLILEEPARMLLENPEIDMPFCFCWANENWTRRWDGNENDILLKQNYSARDAGNFIDYLIPFFLDPRYIRVADRPVLYVYRPASIPDTEQYLSIWAQKCAEHGIPAPYVVAVLTRGASDPGVFGMDAGVERPLQDWTDGAVPEMKDQLSAYRPLRGSVLDYDKVVDHYCSQVQPGDFTWFRSLVPIWDNTARYDDEAFLVHGSTPAGFSRWLKEMVDFSRQTLPEDRRFVIVNAWNEWAEGAHLEPDSRYGYAYLNAVGRTLSGQSFGEDMTWAEPLPQRLKVRLVVADEVLAQLQDDSELRQRFGNCVAHSTLFDCCRVAVQPSALFASQLEAQCRELCEDAAQDPDFIIQFRRVAMFAPDVLEKMAKTAHRATGAVVLSNCYDSHHPLMQTTENGSVLSTSAHAAPIVLFPVETARNGYRNYRVRPDAFSFAAESAVGPVKKRPQVTTVIRFHRCGDMALLEKALYCLAAMRDCVVHPLICAQDLDDEQRESLAALLQRLPWAEGRAARVIYFASPDGKGDLRARMLTEGLQAVEGGYAGFLDYDDLLFADAYVRLIGRMKKTGKSIAFGRVYSTSYERASGRFIEREKEFVHGFSYEEFLACNHAPLHSFLLDLETLDVSQLTWHEDQRYLEDYFLTLQLFTPENADWEGLSENIYVGDYLHAVDAAGTLACVDRDQHQTILSSPEYQACQRRVDQLRQKQTGS